MTRHSNTRGELSNLNELGAAKLELQSSGGVLPGLALK